MTLDEYQREALVTAAFTEDNFKDLAHWVLGVTGEAGEIAEKLKKIVRDKNGEITLEDRDEIIKEIGDVMWYLAVLAEHLDVSFEEAGRRNISKLRDRQKRNMIRGSGDNR
ncbi:MAG: nucleoside triphosphate pyrophosphohydrolase family protein [Candidatus Saccharibacteria bacterium]|nr:nucleoside triphosphate pyrophosphohydrolase family protein [Candidatus Saccharibacteria bacterium]